MRTAATLRLPLALLPLAIASLLTCLPAFGAQMYKCTDANGKIAYADKPCSGNPNAKPWVPKQPLNVVSSESLTGARKTESTDKRPSWLKPIDPVGDCKRKGGKIDPELRACMLP